MNEVQVNVGPILGEQMEMLQRERKQYLINQPTSFTPGLYNNMAYLPSWGKKSTSTPKFTNWWLVYIKV